LDEDCTDELYDVTILFANFAGFSEYCKSGEPEEVVKILSEVFQEFDQMCVKLKVYKVYTVGDCYIALGFNNKSNDEEHQGATDADNIIKMSTAMIDIIQKKKEQINHPGLNMRIGVHTVSLYLLSHP
jgi:class 3 adenylate cyclase